MSSLLSWIFTFLHRGLQLSQLALPRAEHQALTLLSRTRACSDMCAAPGAPATMSTPERAGVMPLMALIAIAFACAFTVPVTMVAAESALPTPHSVSGRPQYVLFSPPGAPGDCDAHANWTRVLLSVKDKFAGQGQLQGQGQGQGFPALGEKVLCGKHPGPAGCNCALLPRYPRGNQYLGTTNSTISTSYKGRTM